MRRRELARTDETLLPETAEEATRVREERRLVAEMDALAREIRTNGRVDLVPEYRRLRDAVVRATTGHGTSGRVLLSRCSVQGCPGFLAPHSDGTADLVVCQTCDARTCGRCGEDRGALHVCDENVVASRNAILRECKPCVRCHAPSVRTEGCPTMWCPHCHTFWNWDTERIIEARGSSPHNPDHRAFLLASQRRARREIDDVPCGGLPDGIVVHNAVVRDSLAINHLAVFAPILIDALECIHLSQRMRHRYLLTWNAPQHFRPARLAYVLGDLTRDAYETTLERTQRTLEFRREVGTALELLVFAGADVFQRLCAGEDDIVTACFALNALRELVDERMVFIGYAFQRKAPRLSNEWTWHGLRRL